MDAQQALADLTEISSQIRAAVVFDEKGAVAGSTLEDGVRAEELARGAAELLAVADGIKGGDDADLTQLEAATEEGSVFVVRQGVTRIAATTGVDPTVGLVFYDLKSALRNLDQPKPPPKRRTAAKKPAAKKAPSAAATKPPAEKKPAAKAPASRARKPTPKPKRDAP
jgi:predicted regulator of Ras-like GTPase activity (Roadblock/LC7/MglB family)